MKYLLQKRGFTLIEVLVVVLIIAVLSAVALPQYQKAVLKSRFAGMMPIGKTLASANEVYYLQHQEYASSPADLPVEGQAQYPDGTAILLYPGTDDLSFVRVKNETDVPNAQYVVYQKHSKNFPDTTWCEAGDIRAEEICVALGGVIPTGVTGNSSGTDGWKAYLLSGQVREGDSFAGSGGSSAQAPVSTRTLSADPSCNAWSGGTGATCNYTYTSGETLREDFRMVGRTSFSCDSHGLCSMGESITVGDGFVKMVLENGTDSDYVYYDDEGNFAGTIVWRSNRNFLYDSEGTLQTVSISSSENPYAVPGTISAKYDAQGNVRQVTVLQNGWVPYYYNANGQAEDPTNTPNNLQDVRDYKLTSAQMAELAGDTATTAQTYATYNKCQVFPESYGCSTNP